MLMEGILFGLGAAVAQSTCYVVTRIFLTKPGRRSRQLFALSHAWMGLFGAALLPLCWKAQAADVRSYLWPMLGATGFYLVGQMCLFAAIRRTDASRVSPLLGLKILVLAVITVALFGDPLSPLQWLAVVMSVTAALILNRSGGRLPRSALALVMVACVWYACSDLSIVELTAVLAPQKDFRGVLLATCLSYILCGLVGVPMLLAGPRRERAWPEWRASLAVAVTWFVAMVLLFACFNAVGAVFGNILQAMRGPLSIVIGAAIARLGHVHLETRVARGVLVRRLLAALLMVAAIGLYLHEKRRQTMEARTPPAEASVEAPDA